jgi:hypothetical protein
MSEINTNGINVNYPIPGQNNPSQGFRDNFAATKVNLDTASGEISDLQNKVVVKTALNNTTLNNDMANTLISNALVRSFRSSTFSLGNSITGPKVIDVSKGDVQSGTITGNTTLSFGGWAPVGTQSKLVLDLTVGNVDAVITFPITTVDGDGIVMTGMGFSTTLLENFNSNVAPAASTTYTNTITIPANVGKLQYEISTVDCGATLDIKPINRSQKIGQIQHRTPGPTGAPGDVGGSMCTNGVNLYFCIGTYDSATTIWKKVTLGSI